METRTYLETRTCGCGITFRVLPESKQRDCGRPHCEFAKLSPAEKKKKIKQSFRGGGVAVPEVVYPVNITPTTWDECVESAKVCIVRLGQYRMFIADLAIKACDIIHGGGGHWKNFEGQHTVKKFAEEAGIHPKTLHEWIAAKKYVVDKLPPSLAKEAEASSNYKTLTEARKRVKKNSSAAEVVSIYRKARDASPVAVKLRAQARQYKTMALSLSKKAVRDEASLEDLEKILEAATDIVAYLKPYLRVRSAREGKTGS